MILWIASYPHSGNSLIRTMLDDVFGLKCYSRYPGHYGPREQGAVFYGEDGPYTVANWAASYATAAACPDWVPIKTHEHPCLLRPGGVQESLDKSPAIWVARDGRQMVVSLAAYWKASIERIILGHHRFGDWSDFYRAWRPHKRDNTILVRFEDVLKDPTSVIAQIAILLKREPIGHFVNRFAEQHAREPRLFRAGKIDEWRTVLTPEQLNFFQARHQQTMTALGYGDG